MVKVLRSLIHEQFPAELRVKIELLSRRRDIINKEKQEELFKLLREYDIKGIVPLGPGTNRYAFKLNGFVIKVATDHDGKIDNLKEFKMAKRLYPHVTKTYEVSENGTLLVAEYIQPFSSYAEMLQYADRIRNILDKLSSVYLIGDVGITSKNYANWGLRIGSEDPVCLDFAYVYEVSSDLFVCRECKTNSMLAPNKDFTALICQNPACGKKYLFEDIRMKIGNDLHRHEIGDLSEEGYLLTSSHVSTELTEERSNYLSTKKEKSKPRKQVEEKVVVELDNFELEHEPAYYYKEDDKMKDTVKSVAATLAATGTFRAPVVKATARAVTVVSEPEAADSGLAFSGEIGGVPVITGYAVTPDKRKPEIIQVPEPEPVVPAAKPTIPAKGKALKPTPQEGGTKGPKKRQPRAFTSSFINNGMRAVSKLSNLMAEEAHQREIFDQVRSYVKRKKEYPDSFYKAVQNSIFRSLVAFCNFQENIVQNTDKPGTHKEWRVPDEMSGTVYEPTLIFMERFWNNREINQIKDLSCLMQKYREMFRDYQGIQREWVPVFIERFSSKYYIDKIGAEIVGNAIAEMWCVQEQAIQDCVDVATTALEVMQQMDDGAIQSDLKEQLDEEVQQNPISGEITDEQVRQMLAEAARIDGGSVLQSSEESEDESDLAFSAEMLNNAVNEYEETEGDTDSYDDEAFNTSECLRVEIYPDNEFDVVKIRSGEAFGPINIPLFTCLDKIDPDKTVPSMVDDRNGIWDWLVNMIPDLMFRTKDPDFWFALGNLLEEDQLRFVILDTDENTGDYIMGVYYMLGIYTLSDDGEDLVPTFSIDLLKRLNVLFNTEIGDTAVSHLKRTLFMAEVNPDLIYDEDYIKSYMNIEEVELDDDEPDGGEESMEDHTLSEAESAALSVVLGQDNDDQEHVTVVEAQNDVLVDAASEETPVEEPERQTFRPIHRPRSDEN